MPGRVKIGRSPEICYTDETRYPVQTGVLSCLEQPLPLDKQQRSPEGKLSPAVAPSAEESAAAGPLLNGNCNFSTDKYCSESAMAERLSQVGLASLSSLLASDQADHTRSSEPLVSEKQNIGVVDCCQMSTSEISVDKLPKVRNYHHDRVRAERINDSSSSVTVETIAVSMPRNSNSLVDLNSHVRAAAFLSDSSAGHRTSSASSANSTESNCSTSAVLSSSKPTACASDDFTVDPIQGVSSDSAQGHSSTASTNAASVSCGVQDPSLVMPPEEAGSPEQELREACGVFGFVLAKGEEPPPTFSLSRTIMDGLVALQHRGQESAGIVTSDGRGCQEFKHHRGLGLVSSVFSAEKLATLKGILGLGHTRYSTAGGSDLSNVQPFMVHTRHGQLALAHNGELINADTLRKTVLERGVGLSTRSDSELITQILSLTPLRGEHHGGADWRARIRHLMEATPTSYSLAIMNEDKIYAVRDPFGNRPLCVGLLRELDEEGISLAGGESSRVLGYVLSSESCAFTSVGATFMREVMPGEIIELSPGGVRRIDLVFRPQTCRPLSLLEDVSSPGQEESKSLQFLNGSSSNTSGNNGSLPFLHDIENVPPAFCIFEYVYFARPDSYFEGQQVYTVRQRSGRQLALEAPVEVDIVSCVPESATPAAMGFAMQLNLPYVEVLHKSRYVGRTFIQPCVTSRKRSVAHKFAAIAENVRGKRVVLVDDSVVRGTTIRPIVKLIRDAGAKEVHFRVASPPIRHPCYMGINIPTHKELVANRMPLEQLAEYFCVDSLQYLSLEGLVASVREGAKSMPGETVGHCTACLSGRYPVKKEYI